jgi:hypothetical protein
MTTLINCITDFWKPAYEQIAYTDVGSADKLSELGLDLRNTANKTLPSWLLPKLTAHALKASYRPDAILLST